MKNINDIVGNVYLGDFTYVEGIGRIIRPKVIINSATPGGYANVTIDYNGCKRMVNGVIYDEPLKGTPLHIRAKIKWKETYRGKTPCLDYNSHDGDVTLQVRDLR